MRVELAVTDAHALVWYAAQRWKKLGTRARRLFKDAEEGRAAIYVPTIVLVEVLEAARAGLIRLQHGPIAWTRGLFSTGHFLPVELTVAVVLRAEELYGIPERSDRLIAATAAELDYPLITRDPEIEATAGVRVVW